MQLLRRQVSQCRKPGFALQPLRTRQCDLERGHSNNNIGCAGLQGCASCASDAHADGLTVDVQPSVAQQFSFRKSVNVQVRCALTGVYLICCKLACASHQRLASQTAASIRKVCVAWHRNGAVMVCMRCLRSQRCHRSLQQHCRLPRRSPSWHHHQRNHLHLAMLHQHPVMLRCPVRWSLTPSRWQTRARP